MSWDSQDADEGDARPVKVLRHPSSYGAIGALVNGAATMVTSLRPHLRPLPVLPTEQSQPEVFCVQIAWNNLLYCGHCNWKAFGCVARSLRKKPLGFDKAFGFDSPTVPLDVQFQGEGQKLHQQLQSN